MRLIDIFSTRTACTVLDYLLSHPDEPILQSWLAEALRVDRRAVQRAAGRLAALGLVRVDTSFSPGKVIALNLDAEAVKALQVFHRSIGKM
jgi:DNA-binding MarR family transcriptional regulator